MKVRFYNIVWDTDGESVSLPTEVTLEVEADINVEYDGADVLSDKYGYCVHSFDYETLLTV